MLYVRVGILLACVKLLYDHIISLRGEIFYRKTNLTWPLLNKVTVSTKESERLYIETTNQINVLYIYSTQHPMKMKKKEFGSLLVTRRVPLVEQELHTLPESLHSPLT
jgi:hypothetical protein